MFHLSVAYAGKKFECLGIIVGLVGSEPEAREGQRIFQKFGRYSLKIPFFCYIFSKENEKWCAKLSRAWMKSHNFSGKPSQNIENY